MRITLFIIFFLHALLAFGRNRVVHINWNYGNSEKDKVFQLWKQYLTQDESPDTLWSTYDLHTYKSVDLLATALGHSGRLYNMDFKCSVLSISEIGNDFLIKSAFYWTEDSSDSKLDLYAIVHVIAVKERGVYKLSNYLNYSTKDWHCRTIGKIKYFFPREYPFDIFKAEQANVFSSKLGEWFAYSNDTLRYYIPLGCKEGQKIVGFEYYQSEGYKLDLCGYYDGLNKIIYSNAIAGEFYKHELIHQINHLFPTANPMLLAGLSAYIDDAGSRNKPISFHIRRYINYLKANPTNLDNFYNISYIDEVTVPVYVFGATICNFILKKGGLPLLNKALRLDTRKEDDFKKFLTSTMGIKDFNKFFIEEFSAFLKQEDVLLKTNSGK